MMSIRIPVLIAALALGGPVLAQDKGSLTPKPLPPLANPSDPKLAAKELFGRKTTPASLKAQSVGGYARGCIAGAADCSWPNGRTGLGAVTSTGAGTPDSEVEVVCSGSDIDL